MKVAFGILSDQLGHARSDTRAWRSPGGAYLRTQDAVNIEAGHGGPVVGRLIDLQLDTAGRLWAVATVDDRVREAVGVLVGDELREVPTPLFWSATRYQDTDGTLLLGAIAMTTHPARIAPTPIKLVAGRLDHRQAADRWRSQLKPHEYELLKRAAAAHIGRRPGAPVVIRDLSREAEVEQLNRLAPGEARGAAIMQLAAGEDRFGPMPGGPVRHTAPRRAILNVR